LSGLLPVDPAQTRQRGTQGESDGPSRGEAEE
jgi:hypothetical protein